MSEPVRFNKPAAVRIAKVVREIEAGDRDGAALSWARPWEGDQSKLRLATFTGNWQTGTYKTVTLSGTTNTVSVYNFCNPALGVATADTSCSRYVIFGKVRGTNAAVEIQLQPTCQTCVLTIGSVDLTTIAGYSSATIQLLGHNESACLQWYSITTCSTATAA